MRCPKCHYLSFEPEPRCRNCGYGFSLAEADAPPATDPDPLASLSLRGMDEPAGLGDAESAFDLQLHGVADTPRPSVPVRPPSPAVPAASSVPSMPAPAAASPTVPASPVVPPMPPPPSSPSRLASAGALSGAPPEMSAPTGAVPSGDVPVVTRSAPRAESRPESRRPSAPAARPAVPPTTELPLFVKDMSGPDGESSDAPLVSLPAEPRPPLAVRRSVADTAPGRSRPAPRKLGPLDRDLLEDLQRLEKDERREAAAEARQVAREQAHASGQVSVGSRLGAAAIDATFLGLLSVGLLWVTLRWCDLTFAQTAVLPVWALISFLLLVDVGYLVLFTAAGGQTIGKMLLNIRVVGDPEAPAADPLTISQAACRAVLSVPSVLVLGAGFVPALLGSRRALHDRLAHTRVVRA